MEKVRNLSLRKSILLYMAVGILAGFLLGAIAGNEAGRIQEQIWWKYVDQDRYIEEFLKRDEESFDVVIPRVSNSRMSDWDARFSEWCDFLQTYGILVMCAGGIIVSTMLFYQKKIRKPLGALRMAAEKIAGNDLDFEIGYENRDELGELCLEFDRMKNQLTQNNRKMWRMVEDEQVLRAAIAHDIRTPLTVLKGYQEMMLEFLPGGDAGQGNPASYALRKYGADRTAGTVSGADACFFCSGTTTAFLSAANSGKTQRGDSEGGRNSLPGGETRVSDFCGRQREDALS